jgi:hypothetical protein
MLDSRDEVERLLRSGADLRIAGQRVCLGERNRGQPLAIHGSFLQVTAARRHDHPPPEIREATRDRLCIVALHRRMPRAQQRQQGQRRRRGRRFMVTGIPAPLVARADRMVEPPAAIGVLMVNEPCESALHRCLALG